MNVSVVEDHALSKIGAEPISESNPCGENIRYESVFEELEAELAKQESLNSETVNWKHVAELSSGILKDSSKDLLVGAYLTQALLINEGYVGLAVGLKILMTWWRITGIVYSPLQNVCVQDQLLLPGCQNAQVC